MDFVDYMRWLVRQPAGSVRWLSTKRDLVELISMVAYRHDIKDERGYPMTQRGMARRAFAAVGAEMPKYLETEVWHIRNRTYAVPPLRERIARNLKGVNS